MDDLITQFADCDITAQGGTFDQMTVLQAIAKGFTAMTTQINVLVEQNKAMLADNKLYAEKLIFKDAEIKTLKETVND